MGFIETKSKIRGRQKTGFLITIIQFGILSNLMVCPSCLVSTDPTLFPTNEIVTSTSRWWPSHQFFLDVISNLTNWRSIGPFNRKSEILRSFSASKINSNYSAQLSPGERGGSEEDYATDFKFNANETVKEPDKVPLDQIVVYNLKFDESELENEQTSSSYKILPSSSAPNDSILEDRSIRGIEIFSSDDGTSENPNDMVEPLFQLLTHRKYRQGEDATESKPNDTENNQDELISIPWINGSQLIRRMQNVRSISPAFQKLYGVNSYDITQGTAPSIQLFTGIPPEFETTLESPMQFQVKDEIPRVPNRHIGNIPAISWGIAPIKVKVTSSTTTRKFTVPSPPTVSIPLDPHWPQQEYDFTRPATISYSKSQSIVTLPPVGEVESSKSGSTSPATSPSLSDILFKIWKYTDDGLQLEFLKEIPMALLPGYNVSDGQVLNLEQIPLPIRKNVASALNLTNSISKRQSGPGSFDAFHWQQLPSVIPFTTSTTPPPPLAASQKHVALNYIIWSSSTTTSAPATQPSRVLSDAIANLLMQNDPFGNWQTTMSRPMEPTPAQFPVGDATKIKESDILTNVASMALIMSKINKNLGKFEANRIPSKIHPTLEKVQNQPQNHIPPEFWSSLLPTYLNYLKHGQSPVHRESFPINKNASPLMHRVTGNGALSANSNNYGFYPSPSPGFSTNTPPLAYDDDHRNRFIFKKVKKKLKNKFKKNKKSTKESQNISLLDTGNFDFNYVFGGDILGSLRKAFYALLAFKAAPFIILSVLALLPALLIAIPKLIKGIKLIDLISKLFHHHDHHPQKIHHYYYPPTYKHHRRPHYHGWSTTYSGWSPPYQGWSAPPSYRGWSPPPSYGVWSPTPSHSGWSSTPSYSGWSPPPSYSGWTPPTYRGWSRPPPRGRGWPQRPHRRLESEDFLEDPIPSIGSLVEETFGNPAEVEEAATDETMATTEYPFDDIELDTVHNQKVMEILMNAKNITLQKLLESWELDFPLPSTTLAERNDAGKVERKRRRRHVKKPKIFFHPIPRIVQIPASTSIK